MKKITVDLPAEVLAKLDELAKQAERSRSQQLRHILNALFSEVRDD